MIHASSGQEAIVAARQVQPAAVLLDIMMPHVDGWAVLGTLKADPVLADIPVVIVSLLDERPLGLSLGAAEFLTKPVDRSRLLSTVRLHAGVAEAADPGREGGGRVLVIDDDERERSQVAEVMAELGYEVALAADGPSALAWLGGHPPPALTVLDLMMPGMDGFALLDRIRKDGRLAGMRIIVLTAKDLTPAERDFLTGHGGVVVSKGGEAGPALLASLRAVDRRDAGVGGAS